VAHDQRSVGIVAFGREFSRGIKKWCPRYAKDSIGAVEASLETPDAVWGRGDDDRELRLAVR